MPGESVPPPRLPAQRSRLSTGLAVGLFGLAVAGVLLSRNLGYVLAGLWIAGNVLLLLFAAGYAVLNWPTLWRVREVAARWAFWPALLVALLAGTGVEPLLVWVIGHSFPLGLFYFLWLLVIFPVCFLILLTLSFLGASLGLWQGRRRPDREAEAGRGAQSWWLGVVLAALLNAMLDALHAPIRAQLALALSPPALTFGFALLIHRFEPRPRLERFLGALSRRLVRRWGNAGRVGTLDLRGAVLGLVAAGLMLGANQLNLLAPLQSTALQSLLQLRDTVVALWPQLSAPSPPGALVLIGLDNAQRHAALTTNSESAVQARLIRTLAPLGACRIVLPLPTFTAPPVRLGPAQPGPALDAADLERTWRDLPELVAAVRAASNVVLLLPSPPSLPLGGDNPDFAVASNVPATEPQRRTEAARAQLSAAAVAVATSGLDTFRLAALPALNVQVTPGSTAALPLVLVAAASDCALTLTPLPGRPGWVEFAGTTLPLLPGNRLLVDFTAAERSGGLARVPGSEVLAGKSEFAPDGLGLNRGNWLAPERFFAGKLVFLEPLKPGRRETPLGPLSEVEIEAHATQTLLTASPLEPAGRVFTLGLCLLCGAVVGHRSAGRKPLRALWFVALTIPVISGLSAVEMLGDTWLDPVLPIAAAITAFLLVTQFTFTLERTAKEQHRALLRRFVAPQIVDELLDDPDNPLGLGGTRQRVCILFADVRGFTQFAEQSTPEHVMTVVNLYLKELTDALHHHGGLLDKYTGDGLMALFRVGPSTAADVTRAVRAALAMRDAAERLSAKRAAAGEQPLRLGIGLHYGDAVVGLVGNPVHQVNYTALGHVVVVGARLQALADGGEVLISEAVHAEVGNDFVVEERAPVAVKGVSQPVRPLLVHGPAPGTPHDG